MKKAVCFLIALFLLFGTARYAAAEPEELSLDSYIEQIRRPGTHVAAGRIFFPGIGGKYDYSDVVLAAYHPQVLLSLKDELEGKWPSFTAEDVRKSLYMHHTSTHIISFIVVSEISEDDALYTGGIWMDGICKQMQNILHRTETSAEEDPFVFHYPQIYDYWIIR